MEGIKIKTEPGTGPIKQENGEEDGEGLGVKMEEVKPNCGCDCFKENKLLKEAILELGKGNALLEDFLQVEFGQKFATFVVKREHLIGLGFGGKEEEPDTLLESRDLSKTSELVELLTVIKDQADTSEKKNVEPASDEPSPPSATQVPPPPPLPARKSWQPLPKFIRICPICQAEVSSNGFTTHMLDLHQDKKMTCSHCPLQFVKRNRLVFHLKHVHQLTEDRIKAEARAATRAMSKGGEVSRWVEEMRKKAPPIPFPGTGGELGAGAAL